jgi:hypothetical protein
MRHFGFVSGAVVVIVFAVGAYLGTDRRGAGDPTADVVMAEPAPAPPRASAAVPRRRAKWSGSPGQPALVPLFLGTDFSFAALYRPGEKWVGARLTDYVEGEAPGPRTEWNWTTSFDVLHVGGRGTDLLVVLGVARNGDTILERWDIGLPAGAPTAALAPAAPVVGVAVAVPALQLGVQGGTPIPPAQRGAGPQPSRTEVYRGPSLGQDLEVEVDPNGRYALVLSRDGGALYRIVLAEGASADLILDSQSAPSLARVFGLDFYRHALLGQQVGGRIKGGAPLSRIVLGDLDNDGVFESVEELTLQECEYLGLPQAWVEDYVNYSGNFAPYDW